MAEDSITLVPPHNPEAEASVLGSMLLDRDAIGQVVQILEPDAFYQADHRKIFQAIVKLYDQHQAVDIVLLREELQSDGDNGTDVDRLATLVEAVPSAANAEHYARIVRDKALVRKLITACNHTLRQCYDGTAEADLLMDQAEQHLFEITKRREGRESQALGDVLKSVFDLIDTQQPGRLTGISSGFYELDDLTSGLHNSELIIVAGRPSIGKTTFAMNVARHISVDLGLPVAMFSLEMSAEQLGQNILCSHARVPLQKLRRGYLNKEEIKKLVLAADNLSQAPFYIDDSPGLSALELRAKARRLKAAYDVRMVVVDYLQLMEGRSTRRQENRQQEISEISRGLKALARELEVPVIAVSQLSRAVEAREGNRPRLSDLRESGSIEQDADVVMLLYREDYYNRDQQTGEAELNVAKQRNGPTKPIPLVFLGELLRFENSTKERS